MIMMSSTEWTTEDTSWCLFLAEHREGIPWSNDSASFVADKRMCLEAAEKNNPLAIQIRNQYAIWKLTR